MGRHRVNTQVILGLFIAVYGLHWGDHAHQHAPFDGWCSGSLVVEGFEGGTAPIQAETDVRLNRLAEGMR